MHLAVSPKTKRVSVSVVGTDAAAQVVPPVRQPPVVTPGVAVALVLHIVRTRIAIRRCVAMVLVAPMAIGVVEQKVKNIVDSKGIYDPTVNYKSHLT